MRIIIVIALLTFYGCARSLPETVEETVALAKNPAAEGFNIEGSDSLAIAIADQVMAAMGGRKAWDAITELKWDFFGMRSLHWNKQNGDLDILFLKDSTEINMNLYDMHGSVVLPGNPLLSADSLASWMDYGKSIWINDSYWLIMPFKLKDSGVTLKYLRKEKVEGIADSDVLELRFEGVGDTPENKYEVFIDAKSKLVNKWSFYSDAKDSAEAFSNAWTDYKAYDGILLSSYRGNKELTGISAKKESGFNND